jgi:hypothetical protein
MEQAKIQSVRYRAIKFNKCDIQYINETPIPLGCFLTERIKIESFQGYRKAHNLGEYLRLRGETNWKTGEQVTGLWKESIAKVFRGDRKYNGIRTLILFEFSNLREELTIHVFPEGYYPESSMISKHALELR